MGMSTITTERESMTTTAPSPDVPPGYKRTEVGVITEDWEVSSVGREFTIQLGKMLDAAKNTGALKPYIGNRAVQWGHINLEGLFTVPMTAADLSRFRLQRGDLLVCEGGEVGRAAIWDDPIPECYYQKALHRLRPTRGYDVYLMMNLLRLWTLSGVLVNYVTQTSIAHLPRDKFQFIPLPVPPPAEQSTIAEVLSDADRQIAALDKLIAKKRAIKQATMQQLLTGRTRLPGFSEEWKTCTLGDLGPFSKGRGIRREDVLDEGVACIRYGELYTRYHNYILAPASRVSRVVARKAQPIKAGDLLFAGSGETADEIGRCAAYLGKEDAVAGGDIVILTPLGQNPYYLGHLMNHESVAVQKARLGQGDAVVHISSRNLAQIKIKLPPVNEQDAIASILLDMDAEITALERRRDKTKQIKRGMMQQLLTGRVRLVKPAEVESTA